MNEIQKTVKRAFRENTNLQLYPDKVIYKRDGTIEFRHGFFYTHGKNSLEWANKVVEGLKGIGITVEIVTHYECWNPWPKDSYWTVTVK